jgi:uncharacterized protein (DUF4415 family)
MPKTDKHGESQLWTKEDFRTAKRVTDLPLSMQAKLRGRAKRGPQVAPIKVPVAMRLSPDVAAGMRATGPGWHVRVDDILRNWLKRQARASK